MRCRQIALAIALGFSTLATSAVAQPSFTYEGHSRAFALAFVQYDWPPRPVAHLPNWNSARAREIAQTGERAALAAAAAVKALNVPMGLLKTGRTEVVRGPIVTAARNGGHAVL